MTSVDYDGALQRLFDADIGFALPFSRRVITRALSKLLVGYRAAAMALDGFIEPARPMCRPAPRRPPPFWQSIKARSTRHRGTRTTLESVAHFVAADQPADRPRGTSNSMP